jgi:hypothetical protein
MEQRGRSSYQKQQDQERARSLSSQTIFDPINSRLSKSNENITQSISQKQSSSNETPRPERMTKSEDRHLSNNLLNDLQIQRFNSLKEKFERQQPIDTLFGMLKLSEFSQKCIPSPLHTDPRRYPFKILSPHPYPLVNVDIHLLSKSKKKQK